jgi:FkbM family methyltransferase
MNADTRNLGRVSFLLGVIVAAFLGGTLFGRHYEHNISLFGLSRAESFWGTSRSLIGSLKSYAQFEQDLWVVLATAPGKKDGFYVDLGSADGEHISNTKLLDELGWKGICIDPFPTNMERRTCAVFRQPVSNESGTKVSFRTAGELGGIESNLGKHKSEIASAKTVELVTATLDEILAKGNAPRYIDYMNIDIEGAEYNALRGLSFDKYEIGAFTIEHNFETEKREAIRKLLTAKGYVRVRSWEVDDWYVHKNIASRYQNFLSYCSKPYCSDLL